MPREITAASVPVQRRVEVVAPTLPDQISQSVEARSRRRRAAGEVSDPEEAETLAQLPGSRHQNLTKFDLRKADSLRVAALFGDGGRVDISAKVAQCSPYLKLSQSERGGRWKASAMTCRIRECPMCDARAAGKRGERLSRAVGIVNAAHPNMRWIFLGLTVRTCALKELRRTVIDMNSAWQRLIQRKDVNRYLIGWSRAVEVTKSEDGSAHPHAHILLGVSSTYFKSGYLSQEAWRDLWRSCARLDYDPVVDVRAIKKSSDAEGVNRLAGAIHEVTKAAGYSVKASQLQFDDKWLCELHDQQSKLRFFSAGGELKDALKSLETSDDEDDIEGEDKPSEASNDPLRQLLFTYRMQHAQYRRSR